MVEAERIEHGAEGKGEDERRTFNVQHRMLNVKKAGFFIGS